MDKVKHHWSGWPGAYCLHCLREDPMEIALGSDWLIIDFDENGEPNGTHFDTPEHEALVRKFDVCPIGHAINCGQCYNSETFKVVA